MKHGLASNHGVAPLVGLVLFVLATASAWGHAVVVESDPPDEAVLSEAPSRVTLRFNARIEKTLSRVSLTTGQGENQPLQVLTGAGQAGGGPDRLVIPLPPLSPGPLCRTAPPPA